MTQSATRNFLMPHRRGSMWLGLLLFAVASQSALASDQVPLPDGFEPWPEDGFLTGLYVKAHGLDQEPEPSAAIREATARCRAKSIELRIRGDVRLLEKSEYWLYRTPVHAVLFSRSYDVRSDTDTCVAEIYEKRSIERMLTADGWSYHLGQSRGQTRSAAIGQSSREDGEWPGRFHPSIDCGAASDCKSKRMAGVSARCGGVSGLVGNGSCVSTERGITRGMTVYDVSWTDDGHWHEFKIDELRRDARINRSVFDLSLDWRPPETTSVRSPAQ
jgi:hypothetical protein